MSKPNIIYVFHSNSTFIQKDLDFLAERYSVRTDTYAWNTKILVPFILIAQFIRLFFASDARTVYIVMFAGFWSVIPIWLAKTFNRKSYLIVGGTDCVSFPEFNYGSLRKPLISKAINYSLDNCTKILPVAEDLKRSEYTYFDSIVKDQGYQSFFPNIKTDSEVIYNGYEIPALDGTEKRLNSFITVAKIDNETLYQLKGIDLVVETAKLFPDHTFTIVGITNEMAAKFKLGSVPNLNCVPFVGKSELDLLFRQHQFYLCLSLSEGFPNALCEGMSYGCVPIGSLVSSIPFIIGNTGYILEKRDGALLRDLIEQATSEPKEKLEEKSQAARARINENFTLERRKQGFYQLIDQ